MKIKFKKEHPAAQLPQKTTEHAGGWDVTCTEIIQESPDFVTCKLGWSAEIPIGYKLTLVPRSSFTKYEWVLQNSPGLGDSDFRGEYMLKFRAIPVGIYSNASTSTEYDYGKEYDVIKTEAFLEYPDFPYKVGERIAQVYIEEVIELEPEWDNKLTQTARAAEGFGSSGN